MLGNRIDNARLQSDFYRDLYHKILRWLVGSICIMFMLMLAILYFIFFQPPQKYYANTIDGLIMPMPSARVS